LKKSPFAWLSWLLLCSSPAFSQTGGPFQFIENKGQWDKSVSYRVALEGSGFALSPDGYTAVMYDQKDYERVQAIVHGRPRISPLTSDSFLVHRHAYTVRFLGANPAARLIPSKQEEGFNNYFIGKDPSKWASKCRVYDEVTYKDLYPGIDARYYSDGGRLKYDLIVHPGADLSQVRLSYGYTTGLRVHAGELHVGTTVGESLERVPESYQPGDSGRAGVAMRYKVRGNVVSFEPGAYDHNRTLVIDPTFYFCSFTGSPADNWGFTATYGADGSMYLGGIADAGFDTSPGAYQVNFKGEDGSGIPGDIAIIKLTWNGQNREWATYIGGSSQDQPHSLIENPAGELIIAGRSSSQDFPLRIPAVIGGGGGWDIIVCRLSADGSQLLGSMKIGGDGADGVNIADYSAQGTNSLKQNYGDDARSEVNVDAAGNVYLASCTQSKKFPVTAGAFQSTLNGFQDGVVLKINPQVNNILWATYLGGSGNDAAYVIDLSPTVPGAIYVGGGTTSDDFPARGGLQPAFAKGTCDGFVSWLTDNGNSVTLNKSTYIGTPGIDQVYGVKFDKLGYPYIMGTTTGTWPIINAPYNVPGSRQFICKLQPDLSAYVYSTVWGTVSTVPNISPVAFLVDRCENVYVSGWGGRVNNIEGYQSAGTAGLPITPGNVQPLTDGSDFYFFVMQRNAAGQLYGSFFGQKGGQFQEHVDGGTSRFDKNGVIYQGICANCGGGAYFPTTQRAYAPNNKSNGRCNEAGVKIGFNLAGVGSGLKATIDGRPAYAHLGCAPLQVHFTDTIANAVTYIWSFGDGTPDQTTTTPSTDHGYPNVGVYTARLISIDPNSCNGADTSYVTLTSRNNEALVSYTLVKLPPCDSLTYRFYNHSTGGTFSDSAFVWNFGDGTPTVTTGLDSVDHRFPAAGTYTVVLTMQDTGYCNSPQSDSLMLNISPLVKAGFNTPAAGCAPYDAVFNTIIKGGQHFYWSFGDGQTSTEVMPTHLYPKPGTYVVKEVVVDSNSCNIIDSTTQTITVSGSPVADFGWAPNPSRENTPTVFTNTSSPDAVRFVWMFGDGDSLATTSRDTVAHQYNISGTFNACLVAINATGCPDTTCSAIPAIILPLLDVPNAFTPGRFGVDGVIKVKGFGIAKMDWKIFNRWGQLVFESQSPDDGWDGKYRGVLQPMDVYAYTLKATFTNGQGTTKTGDITLLR